MDSSLGGYPMGADNDPRAPWNQKDQEKVKVKVLVSVTYSKSAELILEEGYTDANLREKVQELGILPNDILKEKYDAMTRYIASNDWMANGERLSDLLTEKQRYGAWHEDEFEVIEE